LQSLGPYNFIRVPLRGLGGLGFVSFPKGSGMRSVLGDLKIGRLFEIIVSITKLRTAARAGLRVGSLGSVRTPGFLGIALAETGRFDEAKLRTA
jgi:hypothetical protein